MEGHLKLRLQSLSMEGHLKLRLQSLSMEGHLKLRLQPPINGRLQSLASNKIKVRKFR